MLRSSFPTKCVGWLGSSFFFVNILFIPPSPSDLIAPPSFPRNHFQALGRCPTSWSYPWTTLRDAWYYYRLVFFFWQKVKRKKRLKDSLSHAIFRAEFEFRLTGQQNHGHTTPSHTSSSPYLYNLIAAGGESLHKSNAMSGLRGWWIYSSSGWGLSSI